MKSQADWLMRNSDVFSDVIQGGDDCALIVLSYRQIGVAIGWLNHLRHNTAWADGDAPSDFIEGLMCDLMGTDISEITNRLDSILLAIQGNSGAGSCCDLPRGAAIGLPPSTSAYDRPVPQSVIDAGFATSPTDNVGMSDYLCYSGDLIIDNMLWKADQLASLIDDGLVTIAAIVNVYAALTTGGASLVVTAIMADAIAIWNHLSGLTDTLVFDQLKAEIEAMRSDVSCASSKGISPDDIMAMVRARGEAVGGLVGLMLPLLGWQPVIQGIYNGVDANGDSIASTINQSEPCTPACSSETEIFIEYGTVGGLSNQSFIVSAGSSWEVESETASYLAGSTEDVSMTVQDSNRSVTVKVDIVAGTVVNTDSCKSEEAYYTVPAVYNVCADLYQPSRILEECISLRVRSSNFPNIEEPYTARFTVLSITEHP